jgi:hypothetical protein
VPSGIYGILLATFYTAEPALFASLIPPSFEAEFMGAALTAPDLRPICAGLGWVGLKSAANAPCSAATRQPCRT